MLSAEFYERFLNSKYLLIYQLDAYVFKDELTAWCNRGFDYVGAPWTIKKKYENPIYKPVLAIKSFIYKLKGKPSRYAWLGNKVGNGGLSLRKVDTHLKAVQNRAALIEDFLKRSEQHTDYISDRQQVSRHSLPTLCFLFFSQRTFGFAPTRKANASQNQKSQFFHA